VPGSSSATGETLPLNSGDLSLVQQRWEAFIATMKQGNRSIAALLHACEPLCIDGEVVTFGVRYAFHKERLEEATTHLAVEKALSQTLDRPHRIKFVLTPRDRASTSPRPAARAEGPAEPTSTRPSPSVEESPPMAPPPSSPTAETEVGEAENDPLIQAAVKTFGAKVVGKQPIPLTKN
jgi:hypothetical protein